MIGRAAPHPVTPDGRYFVVHGRLWRMSNPSLAPAARAALVADLMKARRARDRAAVDRAKRALGERGPVWWDDRAPDLNRHMARNTPYAHWYAELSEEAPSTKGHHQRSVATNWRMVCLAPARDLYAAFPDPITRTGGRAPRR